MSIELGTPRRWLGTTAQLDFNEPKLHITAVQLTQFQPTARDKAMALHDFVRRMQFSAHADAASVRASEVLRLRQGDCHSKGVLFVALCRAAGVAARLNFVRIRTRFLHGILDEGPPAMPHAVGQVLLNERWVSSDGYVVDPELFTYARKALAEHDASCGWGIWRGAPARWNGSDDCIQQYAVDEDLVHNYGAYHDPAEFYDELRRDEGAPSWLARTSYVLGAQVVNLRLSRLRREHDRAPELPAT